MLILPSPFAYLYSKSKIGFIPVYYLKILSNSEIHLTVKTKIFVKKAESTLSVLIFEKTSRYIVYEKAMFIYAMFSPIVYKLIAIIINYMTSYFNKNTLLMCI